jgi:glycosyltransferase involved in cell wall biosynthesis
MSSLSEDTPTHHRRSPKVSVLIPTFNYGRYLPEAIESVLAQDYSDFEILISDDASADDSAAVIEAYGKTDARIRYHLHRSNLGMVANWNWCLQHARGEYVKFLFGDDVIASREALGRLVGILDTEPNVELAASARLLVDEGSRIVGEWNDLSGGLHAGAALVARCLKTRRNLIGEPSAVMFRRSSASRGYDPAYRQIVDLELWFHLLLKGDLAYVAEPLCAFRRHDAQQTAVNHRTDLPHLEIALLLNHYITVSAVRAHLRPDSLAYRQLLFRQFHYARKAAAGRSALSPPILQLRAELPWHWHAALWVWHRMTRPMENLRRKTRSWHRRIVSLMSTTSKDDRHGARFIYNLPVYRARAAQRS